MSTETISFLRMNRAPALAVALMICFCITPNTLANTTNTLSALRSPTPSAPQAVNENGEVLTQNDANLYRAIFDAQNRTDWADADALLARLGDKRLMGHVLADRYLRQTATLPELQAWLSTYRDLPEADDLYQQARSLPGAKNARLARPLAAAALTGSGYGYGTSSGFRNKDNTGGISLSPAGRHALNRIQNELHQGERDKAKALLESAVQNGQLNANALVPLQSRLAAGYFFDGDSIEAQHLTEAAYMQDDARALWVNGLSNYQQHRYKAAAAAMATLAEHGDLSASDHAAASFWAYRAYKKSGEADKAQHWLMEAAGEPRSFYGMLAASLTGSKAEGGWSWHLPDLNRHTYALIGASPAGSRALALLQVGQRDLAERELRRLNPQGQRALQEAMLAIAEHHHMASLALTLGGMSSDANGKPYDAALYPVPAWQPKEGYRVDRALIYALMRHESHFDPMAVSSQGACGLMQLMPATAALMDGRATARSAKQGCPDQFFDPVTNIGLGQSYVRHLADQPMIGDNLLLLLAAYNGGPGRLQQRGGTQSEDDPLLFMESLPAQETHDYVQQVLVQYWTYRARLNQPLQSMAQLAHGEWPRFALRDTPAREASLIVPNTGFDVASNTTIH